MDGTFKLFDIHFKKKHETLGEAIVDKKKKQVNEANDFLWNNERPVVKEREDLKESMRPFLPEIDSDEEMPSKSNETFCLG